VDYELKFVADKLPWRLQLSLELVAIDFGEGLERLEKEPA